MIKYLLSLCMLLINNHAFSQIFGASEKIDSIPLFNENRKFIRMVNKEYSKLIRQKTDSILLYYPIDYTSNYAVIFWKKNGLSQSIAFYQYNPPKQKMGKERLNNSILSEVNIKYIYDFLQDKEVRIMDTTNITIDDNLIYCKFYFNHNKTILAGYKIKVQGKMSIDFLNAYAAEQGRIVNREFEKSGIQRMPF